MKRTTILADETLLLGLRGVAQRRGIAVSQVMREALEEYLARHRPRRRLPSFVGIGDSGRSDISERIEDILTAEIEPETGWSASGASG